MQQERINRILEKLGEMKLDYMIVSDPVSIFYMTGIDIEPGERLYALLIDKEGALKLFINQLFPLDERTDMEMVWYSDTDDPIAKMAMELSETSVIGIDKNWPSSFLLQLMKALPSAVYKNGSLAIDGVRMLKDETEKEKMRVASLLNDRVMEKIQLTLQEGDSETEIIGRLQTAFEEEGACFSFHPIICFGENAANPHHESGDRRLIPGDAVILDIGGLKNHYCSDMTRTVFFKSMPEGAEKIYNLVKEANLAAIKKVKPGVRFCDVDSAARTVIEDGGYGPYFLHRTGHSIGLEVHDYGDVSSINEDVLEAGMIFSIEPGIYLEGQFGVRIEDLVLVTEDGCEVLNKVSKEMRIIE